MDIPLPCTDGICLNFTAFVPRFEPDAAVVKAMQAKVPASKCVFSEKFRRLVVMEQTAHSGNAWRLQFIITRADGGPRQIEHRDVLFLVSLDKGSGTGHDTLAAKDEADRKLDAFYEREQEARDGDIKRRLKNLSKSFIDPSSGHGNRRRARANTTSVCKHGRRRDECPRCMDPERRPVTYVGKNVRRYAKDQDVRTELGLE